MSVLDYWFWSYIKALVWKMCPGNLEQLKLCIIFSKDSISLEMIKKSIDDFPYRVKALIEVSGCHFEKEFKYLKRKWKNEAPEICSKCREVHDCNCDYCELSCKEPQNLFDNDDTTDFQVLHDYLLEQGHLV